MSSPARRRPYQRKPSLRRWRDSPVVEALTRHLGPPRDLAAFRAWTCPMCKAEGWTLVVDLESDPDRARCYGCKLEADVVSAALRFGSDDEA